jgi:hypothetical protein
MGRVLGLDVHPDVWAAVMYLENYIEDKMPDKVTLVACREMSGPFFRSAAQLPRLDFFAERVESVKQGIIGAHAVPVLLRADALVLVANVLEELDAWRQGNA